MLFCDLFIFDQQDQIICFIFILVEVEETPWFPSRISDLDQCSNKVLLYGADLDADHPVGVSKYFKETTYSFSRDLPIRFIVLVVCIFMIWLLHINSK